MQRRAAADLARLAGERFAAQALACDHVRTFATPRRLAVAAHVPRKQADAVEERRGPRVGAPARAVEGFLRAAGLESLAQCETRETPKGDFYFAVRERAGRATVDLLPDIVQTIVAAMPWPKSMRWGSTRLRWVRPLHGVLCLFDGAAVPGVLSLGEDVDPLRFSDTTVGHRWLARGAGRGVVGGRLPRRAGGGARRVRQRRAGAPHRRRRPCPRGGSGPPVRSGTGAARRGGGTGRVAGAGARDHGRRVHGRAAGGADDGDDKPPEVFPAFHREGGAGQPLRGGGEHCRTGRWRRHPARQRESVARASSRRPVLLGAGPFGNAGEPPRPPRRDRLPRPPRQRRRQDAPPGDTRRHRSRLRTRRRRGRDDARGAPVQGRPRDRHGRRVSGAAGRHGARLRRPRRRDGRGRRRHRRALRAGGRGRRLSDCAGLGGARACRPSRQPRRLLHDRRKADGFERPVRPAAGRARRRPPDPRARAPRAPAGGIRSGRGRTRR